MLTIKCLHTTFQGCQSNRTRPVSDFELWPIPESRSQCQWPSFVLGDRCWPYVSTHNINNYIFVKTVSQGLGLLFIPKFEYSEFIINREYSNFNIFDPEKILMRRCSIISAILSENLRKTIEFFFCVKLGHFIECSGWNSHRKLMAKDSQFTMTRFLTIMLMTCVVFHSQQKRRWHWEMSDGFHYIYVLNMYWPRGKIWDRRYKILLWYHLFW